MHMTQHETLNQKYFQHDLMTNSKIYIEFHKISSFGCPRGRLKGSVAVVGGSLGFLGDLGGPLGILLNSTRKTTNVMFWTIQ